MAPPLAFSTNWRQYPLAVYGISGHHTVVWLVKHKGQRCYVDGDGHIDIVGIDVGQLVRLAELGGYGGLHACRHKE